MSHDNISPTEVEVRVGDGRLLLQQDNAQKYDLLIVDAFSSDAIPLHLLTKEAFQLYESRLTTHGVLLLHISNNFLELEGPVAASAAALNFTCKIWDDTSYRAEREEQHGAPSQWIALSNSLAVNPLYSSQWRECHGRTLWTDNYSSIYEVIRW
jgi:spermidine synthase